MRGYTFRYQLFIYSCDSWLLSSFMLLCSYPSVVCLSHYIFIFRLQFILLLFCAHCLYAWALLFTHTLTRLLSDDPGFARLDIRRFVSIVQVFDKTVCFAKLELLPIRFRYSYLSCHHIIFWCLLYQIQFLFQSLFIWYHAWMLICNIAVIMTYYS